MSVAKKRKPKGKPRGICCPTCVVRLLAVRTIQRADGSTERRRRCPQCGYAKKTFEREEGAFR